MSDFQQIPISVAKNQTVSCTLSDTSYSFTLSQRSTGLYIDIEIDSTTLITGVLCQNLRWIIRKAYYGATGDFAFVDTQGTSDPYYSGLNSRYLFVYLEGQNT